MKKAELTDIQVKEFETRIWFSPNLAKQNLESTQVWYDADVEKNLGRLIDMHGMKYPSLLMFSGVKKR